MMLHHFLLLAKLNTLLRKVQELRQSLLLQLFLLNSVPVSDTPVSNVASISAFEDLPPVATYSQQVYYGAAAAPATITYTQAAAAVVAPQAPVASVAPVVSSVPVVPASAPVVVAAAPVQGSQYHSQDDVGQYSYGYSDPNSVKQEVKTADGVIRGAYSYVDSNGIVQSVNYIADALGFRVGATNLPVHHVDAPVAEAEVVADKVETPVVSAYHTPGPVMTPAVSYAYLPYATNYGYNVQAPVVAAAPTVAAASAPVAVAAPSVATPVAITTATGPLDASNNQYHAQDDFGQYNYGFSHPTQTKQELKTADGVTRGSYSYVDANGLLQTVNYISDAMGFRVAATNLPVHHVEGNAVDVAEPVAEAKTVISPAVQYAYLPYATNYGYNTAAAA